MEIHPPIRRTPAIHPILPPPHLAVVAAAASDLAVVPEGRRQIAPTWLVGRFIVENPVSKGIT